MTESYKLIKNNGDELEFDSSGYYAVSIDGMGNPDIKYTTQSMFFADGEIVTNTVISPRQLNINLVGIDSEIKTRTDFWELRETILRFLTPLSGPYRFVFTRDDHIVFELTDVFPTNGLSLGGNTYNDARNDGRIEEVLRLTAFSPVWRISPIRTTGALVPTTATSLLFPITFPITFGAAGATFINDVGYTGTWRSYPKITIDGPYSTAKFTIASTGAQIQLVRAINIGEKRIIDLTDPLNGFTLTDASGVNKIGEININTNFTQFYFEPDADNTITSTLLGGTVADTRITIEHFTKFLGI